MSGFQPESSEEVRILKAKDFGTAWENGKTLFPGECDTIISTLGYAVLWKCALNNSPSLRHLPINLDSS